MTDSNIKFADFDLRPELLHALEKKGFETPMPVQVSVLEDETLLDNDIIVQAETGSGKTLAFALPLINHMDPDALREPQIIVLSPTRELAQQTAREFAWVGAGCGVRVASLVGGMDYERQIRALRDGANVVVGTPGRILDHIRRGTFKGDTIRSIVLDEGDDMLDMGFREEMESILETMPHAERTWLFSATMPPEILSLAKRYLNAPKKISLVSDITTHEDISQKAYIIPSRKRFEGLTNVLIWENPSRALLFCGTRAETQEISDKLCDNGFKATAIHGDMGQRERNSALSALRGGRVQILVATDVAARGLDIEGVSHVIQFGLPQNIEAFVHRSGRTGRAGHEGCNLVLLTAREARQFKFMVRNAGSKMKMEWMPAPDAAEIDAQSRVRFEQNVLENALASNDYQEWAQELLARDDASQLVSGLLAKSYGDQPSGYTIREDVQSEMDKENGRRERPSGNGRSGSRYGREEREGGEKRKYESSDMVGGISVKFSEGRGDGWEVGQLLGMICRCIGLGREDVGNIKLRDNSAMVELSPRATELFQARQDRLAREGLHTADVTPITERSERRGFGGGHSDRPYRRGGEGGRGREGRRYDGRRQDGSRSRERSGERGDRSDRSRKRYQAAERA